MKKTIARSAFLLVSLLLMTLSFSPSKAQDAQLYEQCGGADWLGPTSCASGLVCTVVNAYYMQCLSGASTGCPSHGCDAGGCGASQCNYKSITVAGSGGVEVGVTANTGYYACCWNDFVDGAQAKCYPNSCCSH
ncbi:hypothetical protein DCC81_25225 [Chitinophaga parva]|uniref:CBM1 domain-containing protein n=1 Tax=Chitinophaga parva TaxID=2169414 RepID=A0A2T7BB90_9BACT|nr:hypothetical protein DCC81_25225 [Chitinophaga parva]